MKRKLKRAAALLFMAAVVIAEFLILCAVDKVSVSAAMLLRIFG